MYRIIIVDDEPIVLDSLKSFSWEDCNCQVVFWAENGTSALEQISLFQPDILISDIRMPGLNGLELSQKIKKYTRILKLFFLLAMQNLSMQNKLCLLASVNIF